MTHLYPLICLPLSSPVVSQSMFVERNVIKSSTTGLFEHNFNLQLAVGCSDWIWAKDVVQFYPSNIQLPLSFQILHLIWLDGCFKNVLFSLQRKIWKKHSSVKKKKKPSMNYEMKSWTRTNSVLFRYITSLYITLTTALSDRDIWIVALLPRLHA